MEHATTQLGDMAEPPEVGTHRRKRRGTILKKVPPSDIMALIDEIVAVNTALRQSLTGQ
jgi:hypothetical protein